MEKRSNAPSTLRTLIIVAIIAILVYLFVSILGPFLSAQLNSLNNPTTRVSLEVTGASKKAVITYTKPDGNISQPKGVDIPWRSGVFTVDSGTLIILTAASTDDGAVKCTIKVGNEIVDSNTNNPFNDKAMCGGYVK